VQQHGHPAQHAVPQLAHKVNSVAGGIEVFLLTVASILVCGGALTAVVWIFLT
jgi:hypothetical protein